MGVRKLALQIPFVFGIFLVFFFFCDRPVPRECESYALIFVVHLRFPLGQPRRFLLFLLSVCRTVLHTRSPIGFPLGFFSRLFLFFFLRTSLADGVFHP